MTCKGYRVSLLVVWHQGSRGIRSSGVCFSPVGTFFKNSNFERFLEGHLQIDVKPSAQPNYLLTSSLAAIIYPTFPLIFNLSCKESNLQKGFLMSFQDALAANLSSDPPDKAFNKLRRILYSPSMTSHCPNTLSMATSQAGN